LRPRRSMTMLETLRAVVAWLFEAAYWAGAGALLLAAFLGYVGVCAWLGGWR